jgi:hypothetical protein
MPSPGSPGVEATHDHAEPVPRGGVEIPAVHCAQLAHRARVVEQWEHRKVRQFEAVLVQDLGLLATLGQVVEAWLLLRKFVGHVGSPVLL